MAPIRAALLGYGRSGSAMHADAIAKSDAFEMAAVCDIDPARRKQAAERFGCPIYDDYHEMLNREALDLVCVVTRTHQHCEMTCDCLKAGVNVLVTKPWAVNAAQGEQMIAVRDQSGKMLLPWLPARWGSDLRRLKQLLAENAIGNVFMVRRAVCTFGTRNDWQTQRRCGGGYLLNWGPHIVDPPLVLMAGKPVSVYARMKQTINPGDVEDVFLALINLAGGAVVQAEFTIAVETLPSWFLQGDRGTIVVRDARMTVHKNTPAKPDDPTVFQTMTSSGEETIEETLSGSVWGDTDEVYSEIAQALRGEKPFPVQPEDALQLSRVFDAIRLSAEQDRVVNL